MLREIATMFYKEKHYLETLLHDVSNAKFKDNALQAISRQTSRAATEARIRHNFFPHTQNSQSMLRPIKAQFHEDRCLTIGAPLFLALNVILLTDTLFIL